MVLGKVLIPVGFFICVVESAVVVNVFKEDDVEVNAVLPHKVEVSGCDMRACDQFCRRLSFASGACLPNGECHCYQFADQSVAFVIPSASPVSHGSQTKEIELTKCSPSACNQLCQRLGFKGGVCVSDTTCLCKVNSVDSLSTASPVSDASAKKEIELTKCSPSACNQLCQSLSYKGGICLSDTKCVCTAKSVDSLSTASPVSDASAKKEIELTKCSPSACNQLCQSLGYKGGICLSDTKCVCTGQSVDSLLTASPVSDALQSKEFELTKCSPSACNQICQSLGFRGGICLSDSKCLCTGQSVNSLLTTSSVSGALQKNSFEVTMCDPSECNQLCQSYGYKDGICLSNVECLCRVSADSAAIKTEEIELSGCSQPPCQEHCRRLGFQRGICLPECLCLRDKGNEQSMGNEYYFYQTSDKTEEPKKEVAKVSDCQLRACEQFCRRLGFPGGACVNGSCDCDRFKTKKRNLWMPCNWFECNRMCRSEGHLGGTCSLYGCQCY